MPPRQRRLRLAHLWRTQVVEAEVRRQMRLIVAVEERPRLRGVRPLGEASAPPAVVLRNRIELRQVERQEARTRGVGTDLEGHRRQPATSWPAAWPCMASQALAASSARLVASR